MNLEEAKAELRVIINHAAEGSFYPEEHQRIEVGLSALRIHARHDDSRHIAEVERYLKMFDSPRKASHSGYDQIRVRVLSELDKIGRYADPR